MTAQPANRTEQGRFPKGVSGNPTGRPRKAAELSRAVRDIVDPTELAAAFWAIALGESVNGIEPKMTDVIEARKWLADRGWGKAVDFKSKDEEDPLGLEDVDHELASIVDELAERRKAKTAQPAPKRVVAGNGSNGSAPAGG